MIKFREYNSAADRREAVERELQQSFPNIAKNSLDEAQVSRKNCENVIGAVSVPLGIAGPVTFKNFEATTKEYYIPLATTEGALVASVSRGCKAITASGGAQVISKKIGITRAPVFVVGDIAESTTFITWVHDNFALLQKECEATSSHLTLLDIRPFTSGRNIFLRFRFDTQDAMGMNMATIACTAAVQFITSQTQVRCIAISGNVCVDKKPNMLNFIEGRGISVWADVTISNDTLAQVLKTDAHGIAEVAKRKLGIGSLLSGSIGANAHYANILAALFLATGQDIAHIAECAVGITEIETVASGIYASVYLPDLIIGTVGGGTGLGTQKECLAMLGIQGGNYGKNTLQLSYIIGAAVLAGELSLLASLANNDLTSAHQMLGRGQIKV